MFNLIITIIAIVLVAALAVATLYYGGTAWSEGTINAQASTLINQGQQIAGAAEIRRAQVGSWPANIGELTANGEYLRAAPDPGAASTGTWAVSATAATLSDVNAEVCTKITERNLPGVECAAGTFTFPIQGS